MVPSVETTFTDTGFKAVDIDHHVAHLQEKGYTVIEDVLTDEFRERLAGAMSDVLNNEQPQPTNAFKGLNTVRVGDLLTKDEIFRRAVTAPPIMEINERILGPDFLLAILTTMSVGPGAKAQPIHCDDIYACKGFPRPIPTVQLTAVWAITEFTELNGATRMMPGTHRSTVLPAINLPDIVKKADDVVYDTIALTMKPGSVAIWNGAVWHGAGANMTDEARVGLTASYNVGWLRPYENFCLSTPADVVSTFPKRLQELLGFGLYLGSLGTIGGQDPRKTLFSGWPES